MFCKSCAILCFVAAHVSVHAVPQFDVNLDLPAEERWTHVTLYWKDHIAAMAPLLGEVMAEKFDETTKAEWMQYVSATLSAEHAAELQSIVNTLHSEGKTEVLLEQIYFLNFIYELESPTLCSGLLAAMPNGTVIHGRNMDYSFHFDLNGESLNWPNVTYDVTFWRDNQPLMTSVNWPAMTGFHTAMRFGGWSFEQNTRTSNELWANFDAMKAGGVGFALEIRSIMETTPNFEDALDLINRTNFMAPQYFIMAGALPYEAAIVSVDRGGQIQPGTPPVQRMNSDHNTWHLVQTNDDQNKESLDTRRPAANLLLEPLQNEVVDLNFVQNFMVQQPLFGPMTVFTWIVSPATGYHLTILPDETASIRSSISSEQQHQIDLQGETMAFEKPHKSSLLQHATNAKRSSLKVRQLSRV